MNSIGVFALRTFAIYQRNWYILAALVVVAAVKVFISAVRFHICPYIFLADFSRSTSSCLHKLLLKSASLPSLQHVAHLWLPVQQNVRLRQRITHVFD